MLMRRIVLVLSVFAAGFASALVIGMGRQPPTPSKADSSIPSEIRGHQFFEDEAEQAAGTRSPVCTSIPSGGAALVITPRGTAYVVDEYGHLAPVIDESEYDLLGNRFPARKRAFNFRTGIVELTTADYDEAFARLKQRVSQREAKP